MHDYELVSIVYAAGISYDLINLNNILEYYKYTSGFSEVRFFRVLCSGISWSLHANSQGESVKSAPQARKNYNSPLDILPLSTRSIRMHLTELTKRLNGFAYIHVL